MLHLLLFVIVAGIAGFVVYVATRPSEFRITRKIAVDAPPQAAFDLANDFHRWELWSPWEKKDPSMIRTFAGPGLGEGSIYAWSGNKEVGEGRMTILDSDAPDLVRIKLEFLKPFKSTNTAEFTFVSEAEGTLVTWSMYGRSNFISKAMCVFMNMEKMVGPDFEIGLINMKNAAERLSS